MPKTTQSPVEEQEAAASSSETLLVDDDSDEVDLIPIPTTWAETLVLPSEEEDTPSP